MNQPKQLKAYFSSPFIPPELISACGFEPVNKLQHTDNSNSNIIAGVCAFARNFAHQACQIDQNDIQIFTTCCDQMRRIFELAKPKNPNNIFLFNMPATWQSKASFLLYKSELKRLINWLCNISGVNFSENSLELKAENYEPIQTLSTNTTYTKAYKNIPKIAFIAGCLLPQEKWIFNEIESSGCEITLNLTSSNYRRNLYSKIDKNLFSSFDSLCKLYFESIHDAFRRPDFKFQNWIKSKIKSELVDGVIFQHYIWCDTWQAQAVAFANSLEIPVLNLDCDSESILNRQRLVTRIQAFIEMIYE